ncbi:MAG: hypothetical protein C4326_00980 [Ignavibacteria bacterium]
MQTVLIDDGAIVPDKKMFYCAAVDSYKVLPITVRSSAYSAYCGTGKIDRVDSRVGTCARAVAKESTRRITAIFKTAFAVFILSPVVMI